jgi:PAS domain S-box-containing protein
MGDRAIPILSESPAVVFGAPGMHPVRRLQAGRMRIDYIGPAGSFGPVTYSIADVLHGVVPPSTFRGKYVLIGATAASQSDRVASPFLHRSDAHGDEHGVLMPGVEVLANAVTTILHGRFYSETSDWAAFLWAASVAALTLLVLDRTQGRFETARQAGSLALIALGVVLAGYLEYTRWRVIPPLVPALAGLVCAALSSLSYRAFFASAELDASIADLSRSSEALPAAAAGERAKSEWLPRGLEWKARKVRELNERLVERAGFVDQALRSVEDGLIITMRDGAITFANRSASAILNTPAKSLRGRNLLLRLGIDDHDLLDRVVSGRERIEREIEMPGVRTRRYILRLAAVPAGPDGAGEIVGIVASLSDITRHHELQQTKNDVIALVSHEMRTPLTAIQGMTELLANYELDAGRRKEIAAVINDEVKRLTGMITEYLDITRLESGATAVRKTPIRVDALLQRIVLLHEPAAARRRIPIQLEVERGMPALFADAGLLTRAVENLLSNAIKYGLDGVPILVRAARDGDAIAISVSDQGTGISEEHLSRIFDKFYRVPRVEDAGVPGTGLGLALVREIAELHGGAVTVTSEVGSGSTFTLRTPLRMEEA